MRDRTKTVRIAALTSGSTMGKAHSYTALLDRSASYTVVSRRVMREVGAKILRDLGPTTTVLGVEVDGERRLVLARVSSGYARLAESEVILGRDCLGPGRMPIRLSGMSPLSKSEERRFRAWVMELERIAERRRIARQQWRAGWHHHAFSPLCKDEVHGRFDAVLGETGFEVWDVGTEMIVAYAGSGAEAIDIADALAEEWRPARNPFGRTNVTNPFFKKHIAQRKPFPSVVWHECAFSALCKGDLNGRFDAIEDHTGIYVIDLGRWEVVAYAGTRKEAIEIAEALAAEWRPMS